MQLHSGRKQPPTLIPLQGERVYRLRSAGQKLVSANDQVGRLVVSLWKETPGLPTSPTPTLPAGRAESVPCSVKMAAHKAGEARNQFKHRGSLRPNHLWNFIQSFPCQTSSERQDFSSGSNPISIVTSKPRLDLFEQTPVSHKRDAQDFRVWARLTHNPSL